MLTVAIFLICYCRTGAMPSFGTIAGTACLDIGCAMFYMFIASFSVSHFFSSKKDYVMGILSIKKEKKNDQGTS